MTRACSACFSDYVSCTPTPCYNACVLDWFSAACTECAEAMCYNRLVGCVGYAPDVGWVREPTFARLRLVNADASRPVAVLVDPDGAPLVRAIDYMAVSDAIEVSTAVRAVHLTDGSFGPSAAVLARAALALGPGTSTIVLSMRAGGGDPVLVLHEEPTAAPIQARFLVASGFGDDGAIVRVVDETGPPIVVGEVGFGQATAPFNVPAGPLRLRLEVDDGPAWLLLVPALPSGVDTLFVLGNAETRDGLGVGVVQSTGGGGSTSAIRVR